MNLSSPDQLVEFFERLSQRHPESAEVYLFGGSALLLIGGRRITADVDYTIDPSADALRRAISEVGAEMGLDIEESAPAEFMPLPAGVEARHKVIGQYGQLRVYVYDPYSIAVMKLDRAFERDIEDVRFLIASGVIELSLLETCVEDVARRYEEPLKLRHNFAEMKRGL
ncbi:hypothetical protein FJY94_04470 [Candidatus Kaiserbacteria bacterium]|nr:hypothetical protein [Candidatus Kaiserbacteria bacterium]